MNFRTFVPEKDYSTLGAWWEGHKWPVMPLDLLPPTGFVVEEAGKALCAGFVYVTNCRFWLIEMVVADPNSDREVRAMALDHLMEGMLNWCKDNGAKCLFASLEHPSLIKRYQKHGFLLTETGMTNLIRRIE